MTQREQWGTRFGLVLAMAGNAIGLGNFLRFPRLAAQYGGGAFLIPYFIALLLLGIPLMWLEWSMGRFGGRYGHSTTPGMFDEMWKSKYAKYIGSLGLSLPLLFAVFYTYIESWTLAYSYYSATGAYYSTDVGLDTVAASAEITVSQADAANPLANSATNQFLRDYQGVSDPGSRVYFHSLWPAMSFWLVAILLNCWVISRGLSGGIERLAKIAMPLLFIFAVVLAVRVLMYGTPDPAHSERSVWAGLNFIWEPQFSALADFNVWLMAAGQIFFTLSIGTGSIQCYASYLKPDDDIALTGLTTAATNEFAEVILGATIAIPIAVATLGVATTQAVAAQGSFNLGFVAMPVIFETMPFGRVFGTLWFLLLFFAGITSSVGLCQPLVAFLKDEFGIQERTSAIICGLTMFGLGLPIVLLLKTGYLDQYDFWVGTFGLVVLALAETVVFAWCYRGASSTESFWHEMTRGNQIRIPTFFRPVIRYLVPAVLVLLLSGWVWQSYEDAILLRQALPEHRASLWAARISILLVVVGHGLLVHFAWKRREFHSKKVE